MIRARMESIVGERDSCYDQEKPKPRISITPGEEWKILKNDGAKGWTKLVGQREVWSDVVQNF